jgi:hypothetical protein
VIRVPSAHGEGNYAADQETLARLEGEGRVVFRYTAPDGTTNRGMGLARAEALDVVVASFGTRERMWL